MRILHVIEATTAGVRRYVTYLLQHRPPDWHMEVACPALREDNFGDTAFTDDVQRLGVPLHYLALQRSIGLADFTAARQLAAVVRHGRFDLIHTHSSKAGFIGRLVARVVGVPVVHTPNGLYFLGQSGLKRRFYLTLEQLAGCVTTGLIAVSQGERDVILAHHLARADRVCVIQNGIDIQQVHRQAQLPEAQPLRVELGLDGTRPLIGAAGRLVPQKNPLAFVRAAAQVMQTVPGARFVWCGDGELRAEVEQLARQINVPLITTGHQENSAAIMCAFDVFVLPSIYEGLPFALLEAMTLGIPVVATDIVGTHEIVSDQQTGWLTAPQDEAALARAICDALLHDAKAQQLARAGQQLVETRFSVERMAAAHVELYKHIINKTSRRL